MLKFTDRRSLFGVTRRRRFVFRPTLPALVAWGVILAITSADLFAQSNRYLEIQDKGITESSGLAVSRRVPDCFWTHNDSGGKAKLISIDSEGSTIGSLRLDDVKPIDWEDMSSFVDHGTSRLLIADVGDNQSRRDFVTLYLLDEPDPRTQSVAKSFSKFNVCYPDGPRDCEAVAVDTQQRKIWFVTKNLVPIAMIYSMALPLRDNHESSLTPATLHKEGFLPIPLVTAMDIEPATGAVYVSNYFQVFRFRSSQLAAPLDWYKRTPEAFDLPKLKQIEALAVTENGTAWVTSEGKPAPLVRLDLIPSKERVTGK